MPTRTNDMTVHDYVRTLRGHWLLLTVATVLGASVALGLALASKRTYTAQASVQARDPSQDFGALGTAVAQSQTPQALAAAAAQTATATNVAAQVKQQLASKQSVSALQRSVSASVDPASDLVIVEARQPTASGAAALANAFADQSSAITNHDAQARYLAAATVIKAKLAALRRSSASTAVITELDSQRAKFLELGNFAQPTRVVRRATAPGSPSSPKPVFDAFLGGVVGLIIGLLVTFGRAALDRRLRDVQDIGELLELPLIGNLRADALGRAPAGDGDRAPLSSTDLESVRMIRRNLDYLTSEKAARTVAVTSALPQEGKSTVAAALAFSAAWIGRRTVLLDCDLRRPVLAERLGLDRTPGLAEYLVGDSESEDIVTTVTLAPSANGARAARARGQLACVVAGSPSGNPDEMLGSVRFQELLSELSAEYDVVVLDCAPVLPVADTLEILPFVDAVVLCVRAGQTMRDQAIAARAAITRSPAQTVGVVVTAVSPLDEHGSYAYTYAYD